MHSESLSELQSRAQRHSASYNLELLGTQRATLNGRDDKSTDSAASSSNVAAKRIA